MTDMDKALALVPTAAATKTAVQSGPFSDPATWGGAALADGDKVYVPAGISTVFDMPVSPRLKWLRLDGTLTIDPNAALKLYVDTFVTTMGGDLNLDNAAGGGSFQCVFTGGPINTAADPYMLGRGLICMGRFRANGRPVTAWGYTTGNAAGSSVVTMLAPVVGWSVGDQLVFPGTGYGTNDDDLRTIQSISADGLTVTLSSPLQYDHRQAKWGRVEGRLELLPTTGLASGWNRPAFVLNRGAKRSIEFESEVKDIVAQRGHLMFMNMNDTVAANVATRGTGRTDKSRVLTDPNGTGGGLDNPRARYGWHYHKCGPALTGMKAMHRGLFIDGSPGWGFVNHDSYVDCDDSAAYGVYGSHFAGEIGTETGCFCRCAAVRSTHPVTGVTGVDDQRLASDWGHNGHGFWLQAGGITLEDCVATGSPADPFVVQGLPFSATQPPAFARANLPAGYTYSQPTLPPNYVPQLHSGLRSFGCRGGFTFWAVGPNGDAAAVPPVGRNRLSDCHLEVFYGGLFHGYSSNIDHEDFVAKGNDPKLSKNAGFAHSGVNTGMAFRRCMFMDFDVGMAAGTHLSHSYQDVTVRALTDVVVLNPYASAAAKRTLAYERMTFEPFAPGVINAAVLAAVHTRFGTPFQPKERRNFLLAADTAGNTIYRWQAVTDFAAAVVSSAPNYYFRSDQVTLDGNYLYFPEEHPSFAIQKAWGYPYAKPASVPDFLKPLTNGQLFDQYGLSVGGRILPADATLLPGSLAYTSATPPTDLPLMTVSKTAGLYVQYTNQTTYRVPVKDSAGAWCWSAPATLTDKSWNVVRVTADGFSRGVLVYCDTAVAPVPPWSPMPTPPTN